MIFCGGNKETNRRDMIKQVLSLSKYGVEISGGNNSDAKVVEACDTLLKGGDISLYYGNPGREKEKAAFRASSYSLPTLIGLLDPKHSGVNAKEIALSNKVEELVGSGHELVSEFELIHHLMAHTPPLPAVIACFTLLKGESIVVDNAITIKGGSPKSALRDVEQVQQMFKEVLAERFKIAADQWRPEEISHQKPLPPVGKLKREGIDN